MGFRSAVADRMIRAAKAFGGNTEPPAMMQAARDISQMGPDHPFSPGEPIGPYDGYDRTPRVLDYRTGYNIATRPRIHERVSFDTLRGLIDGYDVASICIWHKIDTLRGIKWKLLAADNYNGDVSGAISLGMKVMRKPDGIHNFKTWFGKWFYDVLAYDAAPLYRLRNRGGSVVGLMPFDGTCYSDDTEVLTRAGWKRFADVDISRDEFATRNQKTKAFEWQSATHHTVQDWAGREPLYRFHSRSYDLLVTGNHRMLVSSLPRTLGGCGHARESFVPAEVLAEHFTTETTLPATSVWTGTPITKFRLAPAKRGECVTMSGVREARKARGWSQAVTETAAGLVHQTYWSAETGHQVELSTAEAIRGVLGDAVTWEVTGSLAKIDAIDGDDFAAFMGMWLSEGSLNGSTSYVYVAQCEKSKGYQEFRDLLTRILGTEPSRSGEGWRFKSAALAQYLRQFGHAPDKFIPAEILDTSAEQLAIFWRFYMLGDGHYEPGGRQRIITSSKRMADGLQEVAQKIGFQASVIKRPPHSGLVPGGRMQISPIRPSYAVTLRTTKNYRVQHVDRVPYDGKVYCVTVPNETLYVRRNGQPSWCGNTLAPLMDYWGNPPRNPGAPPDEQPEAYVQYVNGVPWNWLTRADVIYEPFRAVNSSLYGKAPIESIILNANTDLRFQLYFLQRFTEGNVPEAFAAAPETWSPDQIEQFQAYWDSFMYGDQAAKHQIKWMPGGSTIAWSNEKDFTDAFSLHMMRKTCAAYSQVPTDLGFTDSSNYSTGESQADVQHKAGELPPMEYAEEIFSQFLYDDIGLPVKFEFDRGEDQDDRFTQAQADGEYIDRGVIGASEIREMRFGLPEASGQVVPRYIMTTRAGPVPLSSLMGVAGKIDPETGGPDPRQPLPHEAFTEVPGVVPNPPLVESPLAEEEYGPAAIPPAPPMQPQGTPEATDPGAPKVAKEAAEGGPTVGITSETGVYGYDGPGDDDEDGPQDQAVVVKAELAAFRRFARARRRSGEWRDFEFRAVSAGQARRLNAEGRAAVRKDTAGYSLSPRSGMISLDVPDGLISPLPGGVTDFHVTVVYLGPDVGDDELVQALAAARDAASSAAGPLAGTLSGISSFAPSDSSDGKVPAFIPVMLPGAEQLRAGLEHLSASEHPDWHPHVTVAYLDQGDPLPPPLPPAPVTFTHLSVHRGDEVTRFPLGGTPGEPAAGDEGICPCGTPVIYDELDGWQHADGSVSHDDGESVSEKMGAVAKAADAGPKAGDGDQSAPQAWPGWNLDLRTAAYWSPLLAAALLAALTPSALAAAWLKLGAASDASTKPERIKALTAQAQDWLDGQGTAQPVEDAITGDVRGILSDGFAIGARSAQAASQAAQAGAPLGSIAADMGGWAPGATRVASELAGEMGGADRLSGLLDQAGVTIKSITASRIGALARVLAEGAENGLSAGDMADAIAGLLSDPSRAQMIVQTELARAANSAAMWAYRLHGIEQVIWVTAGDGHVCADCDAEEARGPRPLGDGETPPLHPLCRCALVPA